MDGYSIPHRKPVGGSAMPLRPVQPEIQTQRPPQPAPTHAHSRTVSSGILPNNSQAPIMSPTTQTFNQTIYPQKAGHSRRTASTTTTSTTSSQGQPGRQPSTVSISLRRSTSGRSGQSMSPTSYVALMRKQKATVWCDRSQHEDPRMAAQAKAAKMRATMEVVGGPGGGRNNTSTSTSSGAGGVRSKIRHHGTPKAVGYSPATLLVGAQGVPMRLSASEVEDQDHSGGDDDAASGGMHRRTGSGRSSLASNQQGRLAPSSHRPRPSSGSITTPPSGQGVSPADSGTEAARPGYFQSDRNSKGSGSSGEERKFGNVGDMEGPSATTGRETEGKTFDDLARRGSVDEKAMTMRGPRLFVANPDLSD